MPLTKRRSSSTSNRRRLAAGSGWLLAGIVLTAGCFTACTTTPLVPVSDDAPDNPRDVSAIPDAVPRDEPLSRYGNPKSYKVYGKTYHTLPSSAGYVERGIASWYGTKFHGKRTSSGEPYDLYAMTAAHKTLPLPTYVEVTNLQNGRKVILKVNDRGPFHDDRIIDLSYAAAGRLGILPTGTGEVEVRAINTAGMDTSPAATATPLTALPTDTLLFLQVGAFSSRANAERMQDDLQSQNLGTVRIVEATTDAGTFYKVQVGPLPSETEANRVTQELRTLGIRNSHSIVQ